MILCGRISAVWQGNTKTKTWILFIFVENYLWIIVGYCVLLTYDVRTFKHKISDNVLATLILFNIHKSVIDSYLCVEYISYLLDSYDKESINKCAHNINYLYVANTNISL